MGPDDDYQSYLTDVLARLQGIQDAVGAPAPPVTVAAPSDPTPMVVAVVLGGVAVLVAIIALLVTRQTQRLLRAARSGATVPTGSDPRRTFANLLRRYSELLGVEVVTGRSPNALDTSIALRVQLETELGRLREPGAVELLDEVGDAREGLAELEPRRRAAQNGLIAMQVEWSIERWAANPRAWLADCREQDRLTRLAERDEHLAAAS